MAGTSSASVAVGKPNLQVSGGVLWSPTGSTRPTDATTALEAAYVPLGYVGSDGVTETAERSTENIFAWGGVKVRTVQTEYSGSLSFVLIESRRAAALKFVFGEGNVAEDTTSGTITVKRNEQPLPHGQLVIDMKDGDGARRLDAGYAQVTEVGDITYVDGEAISYEVTVSVDPDSDGNTLVEYIQAAASGE